MSLNTLTLYFINDSVVRIVHTLSHDGQVFLNLHTGCGNQYGELSLRFSDCQSCNISLIINIYREKIVTLKLFVDIKFDDVYIDRSIVIL